MRKAEQQRGGVDGFEVRLANFEGPFDLLLTLITRRELDVTEDKVIDLIRYSREHVSLDAPVEEDGDTSLGDLIARETAPGPDEVVLSQEDRDRLDTLLEGLDERSADVVRRRYGLLDGRQAKLADIAAVWGITAERVRQIERHAIAKLRSAHDLAA